MPILKIDKIMRPNLHQAQGSWSLNHLYFYIGRAPIFVVAQNFFQGKFQSFINGQYPIPQAEINLRQAHVIVGKNGDF